MCLTPTKSHVKLLSNILSIRDHAEWDEEQEEIAKEKVSVQLENPVPKEEQGN